MAKQINTEHLTNAKLIFTNQIDLEFADGFIAQLAIEKLDSPKNQFDWSTVTAMLDGTGMSVFDEKNNKLDIISASKLRYLADPKYAVEMDIKAGILLTKLQQTICNQV